MTIHPQLMGKALTKNENYWHVSEKCFKPLIFSAVITQVKQKSLLGTIAKSNHTHSPGATSTQCMYVIVV